MRRRIKTGSGFAVGDRGEGLKVSLRNGFAGVGFGRRGGKNVKNALYSAVAKRRRIAI